MVIFTFRPDDVRQTMRPSIDHIAVTPIVDRAFCSKALRRLIRFSVMAEKIFCRCSQFIIGRGLSPFGFPRRWLRSMLRLSTVTPSDRLHRSVTAVVVSDLGVHIHKSLKVKELVNYVVEKANRILGTIRRANTDKSMKNIRNVCIHLGWLATSRL